MGASQANRTFPGEIRQVGHVVRDAGEGTAAWSAAGVGPWTTFEVTDRSARFHGRQSAATLVIALAYAGDMQIELIEAKGESDSVWHQTRDAGQFGPHHIAYWADDFDAAMARVDEAGMAVVQAGDGNGFARFVYVDGPSGLVEIMELTDFVREFMEDIRRAGAQP
jgi:catechol 2,3-dioxygenase-like lactoylglutathione lyase family enzyme